MEPVETAGVNTWIAHLQLAGAESINHLRDLPDLEVAFHEDRVWIRGQCEGLDLPEKLVRLPLEDIYFFGGENRLTPIESSVPSARLPEDLVWEPIAAATRPIAGGNLLPGVIEHKCPVRLIRSPQASEPNLVQIPLEDLLAWAETTAEIRLTPLIFACSDTGDALIRGTPIPSIPGKRWVETEGIAVPAGMTWDPPVPARVLVKAMNLNPGDLCLLTEANQRVLIVSANFIQATRAAIRLTHAQNSAL